MKTLSQLIAIIAICGPLAFGTGCSSLVARKARKMAEMSSEMANSPTIVDRTKSKASAEIKYGRVLLRVLMAVAVGVIGFGVYMCVSVGPWRGVSTIAMGLGGFIVALATSAYLEWFVWLYLALFVVIAAYAVYINRRRFAQVVQTMQATKHGKWTETAIEYANKVQDKDTKTAVRSIKSKLTRGGYNGKATGADYRE